MIPEQSGWNLLSLMPGGFSAFGFGRQQRNKGTGRGPQIKGNGWMRNDDHDEEWE